MFGIDGSFRTYTAFLRGYQYAFDHPTWLDEFHSWLVGSLGTGANLGWEALILRIAFPDDPEKWRYLAPLSVAEDGAVCRTLFDRLRAFDADAEG
ncbi:hypothetical protein [Kribbella sp. NPDC048915]|uniref:hypothetical protein n=1 Tax=Kribbella sp. NPDC048915 TaxID=3155148 RepID=UPI0033EBB6D4